MNPLLPSSILAQVTRPLPPFLSSGSPASGGGEEAEVEGEGFKEPDESLSLAILVAWPGASFGSKAPETGAWPRNQNG